VTRTGAYNIKVSYGNLVPGLNSYQVYGETQDGKKSPVLTVKLNYAPPAATTAHRQQQRQHGPRRHLLPLLLPPQSLRQPLPEKPAQFIGQGHQFKNSR